MHMTLPFSHRGASIIYEIGMFLLALVSVSLLVIEITRPITIQQSQLFIAIDFAIAIIFLVDFCYGWYRSESSKHFWFTRWWELLAAIPVTNSITQALRVVRALRIIRIIRFAARTEHIITLTDSVPFRVFSLLSVAFTLVFISSVAFHTYESAVNPMVTSLFDSFWWAMSTVTTVGYGDIYPITTAGRMVAIFLMLVGIGTLGALINEIAQIRKGVHINLS